MKWCLVLPQSFFNPLKENCYICVGTAMTSCSLSKYLSNVERILNCYHAYYHITLATWNILKIRQVKLKHVFEQTLDWTILIWHRNYSFTNNIVIFKKVDYFLRKKFSKMRLFFIVILLVLSFDNINQFSLSCGLTGMAINLAIYAAQCGNYGILL